MGFYYDVSFESIPGEDRQLYLNIMPYRLGRKPFRHDTELDYLTCGLLWKFYTKMTALDYVLRAN
jgi:hypothetical protein